MKTILFVSALFALLTFSCKKQYTCECTVQQSFGGFSQNANSTSLTPKMTKKEAKDYCETSAGSSAGGATQSVDCRLKE